MKFLDTGLKSYFVPNGHEYAVMHPMRSIKLCLAPLVDLDCRIFTR